MAQYTPDQRLVTEARLPVLAEELGIGGSGSGVEEVSGTVTLASADGVFRQVYASADATVNGEVLPAGSVALFRFMGGLWEVKVMLNTGEVLDTLWRPVGSDPVDTSDPDAIAVTPQSPTWLDDNINGGGKWSTPSMPGVTYSPSGTNVAAGAGLMTWTASATEGYAIPVGTTRTWSHEFPVADGGPFLHLETFEAALASGWTGLTGALWETQAGVLAKTAGATVSADHDYLVRDLSTADVDISVDVKSGAQPGLVARLVDSKNYVWVRLKANEVMLYETKGGAFTSIARVTRTTDMSVWHNLRLVTKGTAVTLYLDGEQITTGTTSLTGTKAGVQAGLTSDTASRFDNFRAKAAA